MKCTHSIPGPHGVRLEIDDSDPHTPAMVYGRRNGRNYSSTYHCALDNGIEDEIDLTREQLEALEGHADAVDAAYTKARAGHPDYA